MKLVRIEMFLENIRSAQSTTVGHEEPNPAESREAIILSVIVLS